MRRVRSGLAVLAGIAILVAGGWALVQRHQLRALRVPGQAGFQAHLPKRAARLRADIRAVVPLGTAPPGAKGDAGRYLNPRLPHIGGTRDLGGRPPLLLPAAVRQHPLGPDWLSKDPAAYGPVDLDWMSKLSRFAYWDLDHHRATGSWAWLHLDVYELRHFARLRLLQGLRDGDLAPAVRDVRTLIRLLLTTERGWAVGLAGDLVRDAALAWRVLLWDGARPPAGFVPPTEAEADRLYRVAAGAPELTRPDVPVRLSRVLDHAGWVTCMALHGAVGHWPLRPLLEGAHRPAYRHLDRLLAARGDCRLPELRARQAAPEGWYAAKTSACEELAGLGPRWACMWVYPGDVLGNIELNLQDDPSDFVGPDKPRVDALFLPVRPSWELHPPGPPAPASPTGLPSPGGDRPSASPRSSAGRSRGGR